MMSMIIDSSAHHISKSVTELWGKYGGQGERRVSPCPPENADPEFRLRLMDKYGIHMQALLPPSMTTPLILGLGAEKVAEGCRVSNNDNYALCKAYPDKFVNICNFSLLDVDSALRELDRAVNELDCRGATLATNQNGKGLDSPEYFPFYEKMVENDLPLFLHPTHWGSYPLVDMERGWRMMHVFGWPFDTTQAVWRLIFGGVLDRYPSLKIVTHHLGAMFPFFSRRVELNVNKFLSDKLTKPISEYWANIYGDTAVDGTLAALPCGYAFFGPDRMLFGSDYPWGPEGGEDFIRENLAAVKAMNLPAEDKGKILGGNARRLLKIS